MRVILVGILGLVLLFLAFQIYSFARKAGAVEMERAALEAQIKEVQKDHAALESEKRYAAQEGNLEKELRARFNYKAPGEKMIIIVPPKATSSPP